MCVFKIWLALCGEAVADVCAEQCARCDVSFFRALRMLL